MIGAAARAGDHGAGGQSTHLSADRGDGVGVTLQLRPHGIGRARSFLEHASALGLSGMNCTHVDVLNSATKSYVSPR